MPEGENLEDVRKRAREAFDEYARSYDGETVLVCAHDAVNKAILCDLLGLPMSHFWQIKQDNACINVIECDHGIWRLVTLNATTHLGYLVSGIEQKGL
ncbi:bifunctional RNase H/acid phosphatase [Bacteroides xylanisolvens]|jgi:broad specificity phosphatase PhoE|nr:bifunctional RNase H/acid phosphatase [Bacteroides xylanisolvens]